MFVPDCSTGIRGAPRHVAGAPRLVPGAPRFVAGARRCSHDCHRTSLACGGHSQMLPGAPNVLSCAPRCSQTSHNHSYGTSVPVTRDPSYSEGWQECPPRVWDSPEIDASKFALHILSDTPGGFQWLKYILLKYGQVCHCQQQPARPLQQQQQQQQWHHQHHLRWEYRVSRWKSDFVGCDVTCRLGMVSAIGFRISFVCYLILGFVVMS